MKRLLVILILGALALAAWSYRGEIQRSLTSFTRKEVFDHRPDPQIERYKVIKGQLADMRRELAGRYRSATSPAQRRAVLDDAAMALDSVLPEMMRCWIGTPWDFHGTAAGPGDEPIACGYFISTVLLDAGFDLERYRLAQQPSMRIISTFLPKSEMTTTVGDDFSQFLAQMAQRPAGIYIVGLDTHVGFVQNTATGIRFLHSSGRHPYHVVDEGPEEVSSLSLSRFRVIGHLTGNKDVLRSWLIGRHYVTDSR